MFAFSDIKIFYQKSEVTSTQINRHVPISKEIFDLLDKTLSSISNEYLLNHFSEIDVSIMKADIQVSKSVINYYKKSANFD